MEDKESIDGNTDSAEKLSGEEGVKASGISYNDQVHELESDGIIPERTEEKTFNFQEKLRYGKNQLNIASAFIKEDEDVEQISHFAREAISAFRDILEVLPGEPEVVSLKEKAERIEVMCSYSSSHLELMMKQAKDFYILGETETNKDNEIIARWYFQRSLDRLQPILAIWGVSTETKLIVERINEHISGFEKGSEWGFSEEQEEVVFKVMDRVEEIQQMPLSEMKENDELLQELKDIQKHFKTLKEKNSMGGLDVIVQKIDIEIFNILLDIARTTIERFKKINLLKMDIDKKVLNEIEIDLEDLILYTNDKEYIGGILERFKNDHIEASRVMKRINFQMKKKKDLLSGKPLRQARHDLLTYLLEKWENKTICEMADKDEECINSIMEVLNYHITNDTELTVIDDEEKDKVDEAYETEPQKEYPAEETEVKDEDNEEGDKDESETGEEVNTILEKAGKVSDMESEKGKPLQDEIDLSAENDITNITRLSTDEIMSLYTDVKDAEMKIEIEDLLDLYVSKKLMEIIDNSPEKLTLEDVLPIALQTIKEQVTAIENGFLYFPFGNLEEKD